MHTQHASAIVTPVYWYFHCDFQQNIALFCAISDFVLLFYSLTQSRSRKLFFFRGGDIGREQTVEMMVKVYPIPQSTRGFGERHISCPSGVWGGTPA